MEIAVGTSGGIEVAVGVPVGIIEANGCGVEGGSSWEQARVALNDIRTTRMINLDTLGLHLWK